MTGRTKPSGSLARSTSAFTISRSAVPVERVALERGGPGRVARAVDALERGDQQLVLVGIGEELDFVDGRHGAEHGSDAADRRPSGESPILGQVVSVLCELSDGVEWGVHVCVLLAALPDDAALPAAKLAEYHGVPAGVPRQAPPGAGRARACCEP